MCCAPYFEYHTPWRSLESGREAAATEDLNLGKPLESEPEVTCFLQGSAESLGEENVKAASPKPPIKELQKSETWKAQAYENTQLVAGANHGTWGWMTMKSWHARYGPLFNSQRGQVNYTRWRTTIRPHLHCHVLCQKNFLPPPDSIFAYWDIWEIQYEKTVAYTRALQFWAEKVNLPTGGKPCLMVGSMIEL